LVSILPPSRKANRNTTAYAANSVPVDSRASQLLYAIHRLANGQQRDIDKRRPRAEDLYKITNLARALDAMFAAVSDVIRRQDRSAVDKQT
jgi:hypothetical protein